MLRYKKVLYVFVFKVVFTYVGLVKEVTTCLEVNILISIDKVPSFINKMYYDLGTL